MASISETLELDISPALAAVDQLGIAITSTVAAAAVSLQGDISTALDSALSNVEANISADTSQAETAIEALDAQPVDIPVEADTSQADAALADLQDQPPIIETVDADTSLAVDAIEQLDAAPLTVTVDADTSAAEGSLEGLNETAKTSKEGLEGLTGAFLGSEAGSLGALTGVTALAVGAAGLAKEAISADTAERRFNAALGESADAVERIDVRGLNVSLEDLSVQFGSTTAESKGSIASLAQFATRAGASQEQAAGLAKNVAVLAAQVIEANPNIGSLGDVIGRLGPALSIGGRRLREFNLTSITTAAIQEEASKETGKSADQLTKFDLAAAGATLAAAKLGDANESLARAAQSPQLQIEGLEARIKETAEEAGKPLIEPLVRALEAAAPILEDTTKIVADVATAGLDILAPALETVAPLAETLAGAIDKVPGPVLAVAAALTFLNREALVGGLQALVAQAPLVVGELTAVAGAEGAVGVAGTAGSVGVGAMTTGISGLAAGAGALSTTLLTVALPLTIFAAGAQAAFELLTDSEQEFTTVANANANAVKSLASALDDAKDPADALRSSLEEALSSDFKGKNPSEAGGELEGLSTALSKAGVSADEYFSTIERGTSATEAFTASLFNQGKIGSETAFALSAYSIVQNTAASAQLQNIETSDKFNTAQQEAAHSARLAADDTGSYVAALESVTPKIEELATAQGGATLTTEQLDAAIKTEQDALDKANSALDEAISKLQEFLGLPISAEESTIRFQASLDKLTKALADNGLVLNEQHDNFDLTTEKGRAVAQVFDDLGKQAIDSSVAILQQGGSIEDATAAFDAQVIAITDQATAAGLSQEQVQALLNTLGLTEKDFVSKVETTGVPEAQQSVSTLESTLNRLDGKKVNTFIEVQSELATAEGNFPHLAGGGPVTVGVPTLVGEARPEVFQPSGGGRPQIIGAAGPQVVVFGESGVVIPQVPAGLAPNVQVTAPGSSSLDPRVIDALEALAAADLRSHKETHLTVTAPPTVDPHVWGVVLHDVLRRRG